MATRQKIRFRYRLWTQFLAGLLLVVPVVVTIYVLLFIFRIVDNVLGGFFRLWLGRTIPGLGVLATLFLTFFIGRMATTVVGRYLIRWGEKLLDKIPLVRTVYTATKQITGAFSFSKQEVGETTFREVVLVPYPRRGIYTIGFMTGRVESSEEVAHGRELIKVFLPTAPNPLTGWVIIIPRQDVIPLNITVEEGFKIIASGGIAGPSQILRKK